MNPDQYVQSVANDFTSRGYQCEMQDGSFDRGVDIIAQNAEESIAIQVKMYDKRKVRYKEVMYLYAGQHLHNCDRSIMITSGSVRHDAIEIAEKLNVEVKEFWNSNVKFVKKKSGKSNKIIIEKETYGDYPSFYEAWEQYIIPLKGGAIYTATGKENFILDVTIDGITRRSSTGRSSTINIEIFHQVYDHLLNKKKITRDEINHLYPSRASAFITPLMAEFPFIEMEKRPARLYLV